ASSLFKGVPPMVPYLVRKWFRRTPLNTSRELHRFRPMLEGLETRFAPAVLTVTTNADDGAGSLRARIANAIDGHIIQFGIQNQTITLASPIISDASLTIDGAANGVSNNIAISGGNATNAFVFTSKDSVVETLNNLIIRDCTGGQESAGGAVYVR